MKTFAGREFVNRDCKDLFRKFKILFRLKTGQNKANFSEAAIWYIKRKLYFYMRNSLTQSWSDQLQKVVDGLNATPLKKLGYLAPKDIVNESSSVEVDNALKLHQLPIPKEPTYNEKFQNQESYQKEATKKSSMLKAGDYVMLDMKQTFLDKAYDLAVKNHMKNIK